MNTAGAERLYSLAGDWAGIGPDTLLFDVCCGTGAIGLTLAKRVGMVQRLFSFVFSTYELYSCKPITSQLVLLLALQLQFLSVLSSSVVILLNVTP